MKMNTGETPPEPMYIPDASPGSKGSGSKKGKERPFEVLHGGEHWETEHCTLVLGRLVEFNDLARCVAFSISNISPRTSLGARAGTRNQKSKLKVRTNACPSWQRVATGHRLIATRGE